MNLAARAWQALVHNFWWRVLALVVAVSIWAVVASEPELSTFATVPVEYRNVPDSLEMSSQPAETVTLELRGSSGELRSFGENRQPFVELDLSDITPGVHTFSVDNSAVRLVRGVRLVRAFPAEVRIEFDRRLVRSIPVKVRFTDGSAVVRYRVIPEKLMVVGPARHVENLDAALTDRVDVSSTPGTSEYHVNAFLDDAFVRFQSSSEVAVTVTTKQK